MPLYIQLIYFQYYIYSRENKLYTWLEYIHTLIVQVTEESICLSSPTSPSHLQWPVSLLGPHNETQLVQDQ